MMHQRVGKLSTIQRITGMGLAVPQRKIKDLCARADDTRQREPQRSGIAGEDRGPSRADQPELDRKAISGLASAMINPRNATEWSRTGFTWFLFVGIIAGGLAAAEPTPSALESDPAGWVDLMPSADLKGWSRVPVPPGAPLGRAQWHVDDSGKMLVCDGDGGHDMLLCDREFGDAIFHCEFRYTKVEGKTGYNSGVYARNSEDGSIWHQAQIGGGTGGYLFGQTQTADGKRKFFTLKKEVKDGRVKPAGEWNTLEITARGKTLNLWVNGAATCESGECGKSRGLVGVEGEGYRIEFRNLKIKELR